MEAHLPGGGLGQEQLVVSPISQELDKPPSVYALRQLVGRHSGRSQPALADRGGSSKRQCLAKKVKHVVMPPGPQQPNGLPLQEQMRAPAKRGVGGSKLESSFEPSWILARDDDGQP